MKLVKGDIWQGKSQILAITTNGTIGVNGLIMGRGLAGDIAYKYPDLPRLAKQIVLERASKIAGDFVYLYGFLPITISPSIKIGLFQTKDDWRDPSRLSLIGYSVEKLNQFIWQYDIESVDLNFPGIGLGDLTKEQVMPVIENLSDKVTVFYKD